jgi:hypothetical protein
MRQRSRHRRCLPACALLLICALLTVLGLAHPDRQPHQPTRAAAPAGPSTTPQPCPDPDEEPPTARSTCKPPGADGNTLLLAILSALTQAPPRAAWPGAWIELAAHSIPAEIADPQPA